MCREKEEKINVSALGGVNSHTNDPVLRVLLKVALTLPLRVVDIDSVRKQGILSLACPLWFTLSITPLAQAAFR
jgi:hypothetical protein